jgi:hypothetical protein
MPLHCTVLPDEGLALVAGEGNVTRSDIKGCLSLFKGQPVDRYGKLINLIHAQLVLDPVDIETIAHCLRRYCAKPFPGPIALSVHNSYNLDMAILLKQRVSPGKVSCLSRHRVGIPMVAADRRGWQGYEDGFLDHCSATKRR